MWKTGTGVCGMGSEVGEPPHDAEAKP